MHINGKRIPDEKTSLIGLYLQCGPFYKVQYLDLCELIKEKDHAHKASVDNVSAVYLALYCDHGRRRQCT